MHTFVGEMVILSSMPVSHGILYYDKVALLFRSAYSAISEKDPFTR
jgi:hypothetical protein